MLLRLATISAWLLVAAMSSAAADINFENALTEKPTIECGHGRLAVSIATEKQPPSHVFAKGHFNRPDCSFHNTTHAIFDFEKCDVMRKRELHICLAASIKMQTVSVLVFHFFIFEF
ncbi:unnamed protein product [Haemonchus placei]|uniref:ZP domain-containing protein n=1 Tax=Haemonchus placei TaxID=6290 RepID=A0A0N4W3U2_HAEPC|nr:unnamed protein product [Haemonchus placei]